MTGNTVSGPLMVDVDLLEVPLDNLLALGMGSVEPSDDLVSNTCFEVSKAESERWRRAAHDAQEMVYAMQSEMDRVVRIHSENPGTELDETRLPDDSGPRSGMSYRELGIRRHAMVIRQQQLRAGASFWAFVYFQGLVQPETSDFAPMSSLPDSARGTALASADYLHDMLRWCLGRFSKLGDLYAHMSEFMTQLQENDTSSKKQFNVLAEKIHELSSGIIGLSSSIRHTQEEQLKAARSSAKSLTDVQWQLSGVGKSVNTSTKESLLSIGKVLSELGTSVEKQGKSMDKTNLLLENLCSTMKTLVDVEQRKSTLVAQVSQAAKAAPMTVTTSTPASVPGVSPPGSAPGGFVTNTTTGGAPQATLGTGNVASSPPAPKLMPTNLTPPMPSGFPPSPVYPPPTFSAGIYGTPQTPTAPGGSSAPAAPPAQGYKRVKLADGQWSWAEIGQGDI